MHCHSAKPEKKEKKEKKEQKEQKGKKKKLMIQGMVIKNLIIKQKIHNMFFVN